MFNSDKQNFFIKNHSAALMAVKKNSFSLYLNPDTMKSNTLYVVLMLISLVLLIMDIYDGALSKSCFQDCFLYRFCFSGLPH